MDSNPSSSQKKPTAIPICIPISSLLILAVSLCVAYGIIRIAPLFLPAFIGALLAVALAPIVRWLQSRGLSRSLGILTVAVTLLAAIMLISWLVVPEIGHQLSAFFDNLPQVHAQILDKLGKHNPIRVMLDQTLTSQNLSALNLEKVWGAGNMVLSGFAEIILIFIFSIYLLLDGPYIIEWARVYFAPKTQDKITRTLDEMGEIIFAYVLGQFITSAISFAFVFVALSFLGVKSVLLLATLAGVLDVLPVLGFILAVVPAMLFALDISVETSFFVLGLYVFYHAIENYVIVPYVYGNRLRVSSFVVFFTLLAAGLLAGIEGAIAVLPIVASYPIIERIWLGDTLRAETLRVHEAELRGELEQQPS